MCSHFNLSSGYLKSSFTFAQIKFWTYGQSFVGGLVVIVVGNVVVVPEIISCKSEKSAIVVLE